MSSILELFLDHLVYERNLVEIRLHKRGIDLPESFWTGLSFPITGADLKKAFPRELATMEQSCVRRINVRLNRSQAHRLACLARLYKMTRSAWVRHALHHPCPPITKERTLRFLTDLRRFRGNLTQLVRHRVFPHHCARLKIETEAVEGFLLQRSGSCRKEQISMKRRLERSHFLTVRVSETFIRKLDSAHETISDQIRHLIMNHVVHKTLEPEMLSDVRRQGDRP